MGLNSNYGHFILNCVLQTNSIKKQNDHNYNPLLMNESC